MSTEVDVRLYDLYLHKCDGNEKTYQHKNDGKIQRKMDIYINFQVVISSTINWFVVCLIPVNVIECGMRCIDFS